MSALRKSGIALLGEIPWGSHFCNFYETKQDLLDTLVPYFKTGLESKEFCLWVVANSGLITTEEAKEALEQAVPGLDRHFSDKNIEILTESDWYLEDNVFNLEKVINGWHAKLNRALALGYKGMRVSGDTFWLDKKIWKDFIDYEKQITKSITDLPMILLCTYPLAKSGAAEILDVAHAHQFAIARRQGKWEIIESPELIQAKAEIKKLNEELEQRVVERTRQLESANNELRNEITERRIAEEELKKEKEILAKVFDNIPVMIGFVGGDGVVKLVNPEWERTIGWTLKELQEQNVDIFAKAYPDPSYRKEVLDFVAASTGEWMDLKIKVRDGRVIDAACAVVHLSDGTKVAIAQDITVRKQAEDELRKSEDRIQLIIDTIPTMVWSILPDATVDFLNQQWLDYTGLSLEQYTKVPMGPVHPEDIQRAVEKWLLNKVAGKAFDDEIRMRRSDGEYHWFLVRTAPLRDKQGKIIKWYGLSIDIEDSKRAKDELRAAYQRLSLHVENTPLAVIEFDKDLFIKRWSKHAEEIFGWKESEALGKNVYDPDFPIIYKEDIPEVDKINEQLMKGIVSGNFSSNRNYTKDGNIIYSEWYNSVLKDEHGNVIAILSLVHNVTERKKAEEQKEFEQRDKEALINSTDDMIWSVSRDLKLIAVNKAYIRGLEALTGVTVKPGDEVLMQDVLPWDIVSFWKEAYNRALSGEAFKQDTIIPAFNKSAESWRETSYNPIYKDGTVVALACYSRDITERKLAEERIRRSEAHLAEAQRLAKLGSWDFDIKADRLTWSEELYNIFDTDKQTFKETHGSFLHLVNEEDREFVLQTSRHTQQTGEPFTIEYHITTSKGEKRVIQEYGYGQRDDSGKLVCLFGTAQDITERKRAEETLKQSYEEIRQLTKHLQKIREEERTYIAREIHDELGQQLTAIKMDVAWIDKKIPVETTDIKRKLKNIIELLDGSNQSVRKILSELRSGILDDHGLLEALKWQGRQFTERTGIPVEFTTTETAIKLPEEIATCIFRVYQESLTNIMRYAQANKVITSLKILYHSIIVSIEDNGKGFIASGAQNDRSFGILGMKERVGSVHGKFNLVSTPGKGTSIIISIPYKA
jgi:PAS domain S-box-containing protein